MSSTCKKRRFVSHGGDVWGFARKHNIPLEKVLDFSGPVNFLGPPKKALEAVKKNAKLIRFYPDPNPMELKAEIAKYVGHGVKESNIILGNGSIELIYMITEVFPCNFKAIIPVPSFTEYEKAALRVGGDVIFVQLPDNFALEPERSRMQSRMTLEYCVSATRIVLQELSTTEKRFWTLSNSAVKRTLLSAWTRTTLNSPRNLKTIRWPVTSRNMTISL